MSEIYSFKRVTVRICELQSLGDEGWELIDFEYAYPDHLTCLFRRSKSTIPWEYHIFDIHDPEIPGWLDHLSSCGWTLYEPKAAIYTCKVSIAKRKNHWRGTDDGDVPARLEDLGWPIPFSDRKEIISEILETKWMESKRLGHNIGTYQAVIHWLAHKVVPNLLRKQRAAVPDLSSAFIILEELENLRLALGSECDLAQAVERWCALKLGQ